MKKDIDNNPKSFEVADEARRKQLHDYWKTYKRPKKHLGQKTTKKKQ